MHTDLGGFRRIGWQCGWFGFKELHGCTLTFTELLKTNFIVLD